MKKIDNFKDKNATRKWNGRRVTIICLYKKKTKKNKLGLASKNMIEFSKLETLYAPLPFLFLRIINGNVSCFQYFRPENVDYVSRVPFIKNSSTSIPLLKKFMYFIEKF